MSSNFPKPKNRNSKGFAHLEIILAVVVVIIIVAIGGFVYAHHNKAHAGGWTEVGVARYLGANNSDAIVAVYGCYSKYSSTSGVIEGLFEPAGDTTSGGVFGGEVTLNGSTSQKTGYASGSNFVVTHGFNPSVNNTVSFTALLRSSLSPSYWNTHPTSLAQC